MRRHSRERLDELAERKSDVLRILSKWSSEKTTNGSEVKNSETSTSSMGNIEEFCPVGPPLEDLMRIPSEISRSLRTRKFFQDLRKGDVLYGVVSSKLASGLTVQLLACEWSTVARSIHDLGIKGSQSQAFCPSDHIPTANPRHDPVDMYELEDTLRVTVLTVLPNQDKVFLSLSQLDMENAASTKLTLGLVAPEELPKYYRQSKQDPPRESEDLTSYVRRQRQFDNPAFLEMMRVQLGVPTSATTKRWHSLLPGFCGKQVKPEESAEELTAIQSSRWSMKSVEEGVRLMKEDNIPAALGSLNKAVEMNKKNVEAFVARGALYARKEDFHRAIRDFEDALKMNRNHRNARKYLADTYYHLGKKFETDEPGRALKFFKDALHLDPKFQEAQEAERKLSRRHQDHIENKSATKEPSLSTAEKLRQMLLSDTAKSNSKRSRRTRSQEESPSPERKQSRRQGSPAPQPAVRMANQTLRNVSTSRDRSRDVTRLSGTASASGKPEGEKSHRSPVVQVDVDDLEAQLEAFRSAKKAQLLANNKDIQKRNFL